MYKGNSFIAIIPARGGSKGIPKKNVKPVRGKPLIQYSIDEAMKSKYLDRIIVSTDSTEIADISITCGADVPFLRPPELATDSARTIDVLVHAINELASNQEYYDFVVLLQPTQPLRRHWHIDEAIAKIVDENKNGLVSVSEVSEHPILMRTLDESGHLKNILNRGSTLRRQDFPNYFRVNGAIYINKVEYIHNNISLNDNRFAYVMEKKFDLDIDDDWDLEVLELILKKNKLPTD